MASGHIAQAGKGVLMQNTKKTSDKSPDWKGTLMLSEDYKAGQTVKIAGWIRPTPMGSLISLSEDNWKPNPDSNYPKEIPRKTSDQDVPF